MSEDFLGQFIGNPARARILRVFVLEPEHINTIRDIAKRSGTSASSALREVKALEKMRVIKKGKKFSIELANGTKRKVVAKHPVDTWVFNPDFKHARTLSSFVREISPMKYETIVTALKQSGRISAVVLSGNFMGDPTRPADMLIAGDSLNERRLETAIRNLEPTIGREIRYAAFTTPEFRYRLTVQDRLIRDTLDFPHLVLLDRVRLL